MILWEQVTSLFSGLQLILHWGVTSELILHFTYHLKCICTNQLGNLQMYILSSSLNKIQMVTKYNHRVYYLVVLPSVEFITPHLELKLFLNSVIVKYRSQHLFPAVLVLLIWSSALADRHRNYTKYTKRQT